MPDILVVDDDEDVAFLIEAFLEAQRYHVRVARNGEVALAQLDRELPDLVISDVEMPLMTGPAMSARMIIEDLGRELIPIVLVSGTVGLASIAADVGTPYYLAKPFPPDALLAVVTRALDERRAPAPTNGAPRAPSERRPIVPRRVERSGRPRARRV